jgi:MSHA biogenesis protein MshM
MSMYLEHFGLAEAPFKITPHTEFFFAGAHRGETLEALIYAITSGEGMVKVTGEVGAGKTMLCRVLMERLPDTVETIYLAVPSLSRDEMLSVIADDLGIDTQGGNTTKLVRALQEKLIEIHEGGRQVVALIDEAHAMPLETLEQIRLLSNLETSHDKLMQIVLFGQPELDAHLLLPHMRQLKERITHSFTLKPLPANDVRDYLNFRLRAAGYKGPDLFGTEALKLIAEASEGLTRRINIYADKTLLAAYAAGTHTITADHVRAAVSDTQIVLPQAPVTKHRASLAVAATLLIGLAVGFMAGRFSVSTAPIVARDTGTPNALRTADSGVGSAQAAVVPTMAQPASVATVTAVATEPSPTRTAANDAPAPVATVAATLDERLAADAARLKSLNPSAWAIQLMNADARDRNAVDVFLRQAGRELGPAAVRLIALEVGSTANPRVSVVLAPFANRSEANAEMTRLPGYVMQYKPYARAVQMVAAEVRKDPQTASNRTLLSKN